VSQPDASDFAMEADDLYREEIFTDRRVGTVRRLTPIRPDGNDDPTRLVLYLGQAQMMTPLGALPLTFEIPADTLADAVRGFGAGAQRAAAQAIEELKELRREAASSIVIPGADQGGFGALPGGGKIQF
jgi:hypothetical protein